VVPQHPERRTRCNENEKHGCANQCPKPGTLTAWCGGLQRSGILGTVRRDEAIPDAWDGLDRVGRFGIAGRKFAELADAPVNCVVADGKSAPTANDQIVLRYNRAARLSERHKDLHDATLQGLSGTIPLDFARGRPNAQRSELEIRLLCQVDTVHPRDVLR